MLPGKLLNRPTTNINGKLSTNDSLGAVSYTHLRAHETSLHLVCRLLLEKKKVQSKPTTLGDSYMGGQNISTKK